MISHPFQYRGGWAGTETWSDQEDRWIRTVTKGGHQVDQGTRTYEQLLDALDRIDGRPVMRDFINGLLAGMTAAEASVPVPFGPDGAPLPAGFAPAAARPVTLPAAPGPAPVLVAVQRSLFDEAWA